MFLRKHLYVVKHDVTHAPSFAMLRVDLEPGERLVSEAGAMVARSPDVNLRASVTVARKPGLLSKLMALLVAVVRKLVANETFFVTHYSAPQGGAVWLAPGTAGSVARRDLQGEAITLSTGAYLASSGDVEVRLRFGGWRAIFAEEGLFFLTVSGTGSIWYTTFGGGHVVEVKDTFVVDTGHLVGWEGDLTFDVRNAGGGVVGFLASGEGLVCEFRGRGKVYLQSRNVLALADWLTPLLPSSS